MPEVLKPACTSRQRPYPLGAITSLFSGCSFRPYFSSSRMRRRRIRTTTEQRSPSSTARSSGCSSADYHWSGGSTPNRAPRSRRARCSRGYARRVRCEGLVERSELVKALEATPHDDLCAICYDEYEEGTELRLLPCNHTFHCECVDRWLLDCGASRRAVACPLCNHPLDTKSAARAAAARGREQQWRRHPWREAVRAVERWARQVGHPFAIWAPRQPMQVVH